MTPEGIRSVLTRAPEPWVTSFIALCDEKIPDKNERAMLLAQLAHESAEFTRLEENLNYSAERLSQVWPRRFPTPRDAAGYAHNPEALANRVYANRLGNGDVTSGDGWKFRGRGPIQLTGRSNYAAAASGAGFDFVNHPELLCQPEGGLASAYWFWVTNRCAGAAREGNVAVVTQKINGGQLGLEQRKALYTQLLAVV